MYTAFYGLREKPFSLTPDPRYLFLAESHREALAHLLYGIDQGEGFIAVTGEVGTGKTTLCRTLLERLGAGTEVAFLFNPSRSATELLQDVAAELGLEGAGPTRREISDQLNQFLLQKNREGKRVLLIVDEAQNLTSGTLEQVRLLSNLETPSSKLIQILLLGQPELDAKLDSPSLRQLRQRISVRWSLSPLTRRETAAYVRHRLRVAAGGDRPIFSDAALREIHRRSRGVPRLVNILCDRSLLAGYGEERNRIDARLVQRVAREIPDARRRGLRPQRPGRRQRARAWRTSLLRSLVASALFAAAVVAGLRFEDLRAFVRERLATAESAVAAVVPGVAAAPPAAELAAPGEAAEPAAPAEVAPPADAGEGSPPAEVEPLGALLDRRDAASVRLRAVNTLLDSYGLPPERTAPDSLDAALQRLEDHGLTWLPLEAADLEGLRALNHPALLDLRTAQGGRRLLALLHLDGDVATCRGAMEGVALRLPVSELLELWDREAFVVWRDFEDISSVLEPNAAGEGVRWLQGALAELGLYSGLPSGRFDESTLNGVLALQAGRRLKPDGRVGPRTKMVLYDMLGHYSVPRLSGREGSG
jgi:general secretion pathway protein A